MTPEEIIDSTLKIVCGMIEDVLDGHRIEFDDNTKIYTAAFKRLIAVLDDKLH